MSAALVCFLGSDRASLVKESITAPNQAQVSVFVVETEKLHKSMKFMQTSI